MIDGAIQAAFAGVLQSAVQSACFGLALIVVSIAARRVSAPWAAWVLVIGLVRFALPALPSPIPVRVPWLPAMSTPAAEGTGVVAIALLLAWLAGAAFQGVRLVRARRSWSQRLVHSDESPELLLEEAQRAAQALGIATPRVRMSDDIEAPLVIGLRHSTVIVDRGWLALDDRARQLVLLHEMAHVKRGDLRWVELASWLSVVWWWNPVFRVLVARMRSAQEDACDDLAMLAAPEPERYCRLLLETAGRAVAPMPALALEPLGFNGRLLERRIRRLMNPATRHAGGVTPAQWVMLALAVTLASAVFGSYVTGGSARHSPAHHPHHHAHSH